MSAEPVTQEDEAVQEGDTSVALDQLVERASGLVNKGTITFNDLLKAIVPIPKAEPAGVGTAPLPAKITKEQREALEHLHEVFGSVAPSKRRELRPSELTTILDERATVDTVLGMAADRKGDIREIVCNHLDVRYESECAAEGVEPEAEVDDKGHYILGQREPVPETDKAFSREVRDGTVNLTPDRLKGLVGTVLVEADPERGIEEVRFTHDDYLSMTTQVRVFDEHKAMLHLKHKPGAILALSKATARGQRTASLYVRKQK